MSSQVASQVGNNEPACTSVMSMGLLDVIKVSTRVHCWRQNVRTNVRTQNFSICGHNGILLHN